MKLGGTIVWVAACPEGSGSKHYEEFMRQVKSQRDVLDRFTREPFRLGDHKAFQIARDATRVRVLMVTEMPPKLCARLLLSRCESLDAALDTALKDLPRAARIGIMPVGNVTVPTLD